MKEDLIVAAKLALLCFVAVTLLSLVYALTNKKIQMAAERSVNESNSELFPDGAVFEKKQFSSEEKNAFYYSVLDASNKNIGFIASISGQGFSGDLPLLIAFDENLKVLNMKLLKNSETPGFGKKWEKQKSMDMFVGTNTAEKPFPHKKSMISESFLNVPHGVSGATITFNGITEATKRAIELMERMRSKE